MLSFREAVGSPRRVAFAIVAATGVSACDVPSGPDTSYQQNGPVYQRGNVNLPANCNLTTTQPVIVRPDGTVVAQDGSGRIICSGDSDSNRRSDSIQEGLRDAADTVRDVTNVVREIRRLEYWLD